MNRCNTSSGLLVNWISIAQTTPNENQHVFVMINRVPIPRVFTWFQNIQAFCCADMALRPNNIDSWLPFSAILPAATVQ